MLPVKKLQDKVRGVVQKLNSMPPEPVSQRETDDSLPIDSPFIVFDYFIVFDNFKDVYQQDAEAV